MPRGLPEGTAGGSYYAQLPDAQTLLPLHAASSRSIEYQPVKQQHIAKHYEYRGRGKDKTSSGMAAIKVNTADLQA